LEDDDKSSEFDTAKAELFEAISHPVRIKILQVLNEKPMGFAELRRTVGIESGGHLSFHLNKLRYFVKTNAEGNYALTPGGKEALWSVNSLQRSNSQSSSDAGRAPLKHKSLLKPILAVIVIAIFALGAFGAYQQQEFATQQQQLASQQRLIGSLQVGVPFVSAQPASLVIGQKDFSSAGQATSQNGLSYPSQALFDASGNLWVIDSNNYRVLEFKPPFSNGMAASLVIGQGSFTRVSSGPSGNSMGSDIAGIGPVGAAFDSAGDLWVSDTGNNRILEFLPPFVEDMPASLVIGQTDFASATFATTRDGLNGPTGIAFDSAGDLWVLDTGNNRVLEYFPPFSNGMNATLVIGQPDFGTASASSNLSGLNTFHLYGDLAIDSSDNVWVGDADNNRILEFVPPFSNGMKASLVIGQANLVANTTNFQLGGGIPENYNLGTAIAFDHAGNLWAAYNNRMLVFRPPFTRGIRTFPSVEIGQPNFTATLWLGGQSGLFAPGHPGFDSHQDLWIPDGNNNRVLEFVAGPSSSSHSNNSQTILGLGQIDYVIAGVATVTITGASLAFWRSRGRKT